MGTKKIKKTQQEFKVWICCACKTKDVDIVPKEVALSQNEELSESNEDEKNFED